MQKKFLLKIFIFFLSFMFASYLLVIPSIAFSPSSNNIYEGIDVSTYQGNVDYNQVKASGIDIVYIKASEGFTLVDPKFEQNYARAKAAGLKIGFYHYVTATTTDAARQQATFFASVISGKEVDCRLAMDFENFRGLDNYSINLVGEAFMQKLQEITGKEVVLYSNAYNARNTFTLTQYPLWVAHYYVSEPSSNGKWDTWVGWQYTDQGEVAGISAYVDRDKFTDGIFLSNSSPIPTPPYSPSPSPGTANTTTIIIPYGATLSGLAIKYNTTVSYLVELNGIQNPNLIYAGNRLIVPVNGSYTPDTSDSETITYIVQRGDTLSQIALDYNTTVEAIASINNIRNVNLIYTGQTLQIPCYNCDMSHKLYVVRKGDTLWGISRRFGVSISHIVMLNRIQNPNLIYPGNVLRI